MRNYLIAVLMILNCGNLLAEETSDPAPIVAVDVGAAGYTVLAVDEVIPDQGCEIEDSEIAVIRETGSSKILTTAALQAFTASELFIVAVVVEGCAPVEPGSEDTAPLVKRIIVLSDAEL